MERLHERVRGARVTGRRVAGLLRLHFTGAKETNVMGKTINNDKGNDDGRDSDKDISSGEVPRRTGGAASPNVARPSGRFDWPDYALRWAPYIGPILLGLAAIITALLKVVLPHY
jgi:hypothetical protein